MVLRMGLCHPVQLLEAKAAWLKKTSIRNIRNMCLLEVISYPCGQTNVNYPVDPWKQPALVLATMPGTKSLDQFMMGDISNWQKKEFKI